VLGLLLRVAESDGNNIDICNNRLTGGSLYFLDVWRRPIHAVVYRVVATYRQLFISDYGASRRRARPEVDRPTSNWPIAKAQTPLGPTSICCGFVVDAAQATFIDRCLTLPVTCINNTPITTWWILWTNLLNLYAELNYLSAVQNKNSECR